MLLSQTGLTLGNFKRRFNPRSHWEVISSPPSRLLAISSKLMLVSPPNLQYLPSLAMILHII